MPPSEPDLDAVSFCESVTATSISPWCIRQLTEAGRKLGGGVDTPSLCGRVKVRMGWDLKVPVDLKHPSACPRCVEAFPKAGAGAPPV